MEALEDEMRYALCIGVEDDSGNRAGSVSVVRQYRHSPTDGGRLHADITLNAYGPTAKQLFFHSRLQ